MKRIVILAALAVTACGPKEPAPAPTTPAATVETPASPAVVSGDALTSQGWGPLKIGMTQAEVTAALGPDANPNAVGGPDEEACNEYRPAKAPEGMLVMIQEGKLTRISLVELSAVTDAKGVKIGTPAADVKAAYGAAVTTSAHKYQDAPAEYLTLWDGGPRPEPYVEDAAARGIVYEIDGTGKVGAIHAGDPSIQYVEGCA